MRKEICEGIVRWFDNEKGYGFIDCNNNDVFVHYKAVEIEGYKTLNQNQKVSFSLIETDKGLQAKNVSVLEEVLVD